MSFVINGEYPSTVRFLVNLLAVIATFVTSIVAQAQEWERYHAGIAVGPEPRVSPDPGPPSVPEPLLGTLDSSTGWKVLAGFRPLRVLGVEMQYVDFGTAEVRARSSFARVPQQLIEMNAHSTAVVFAATLFIPKPSPSFDFYGKIGVAQLRESVRVFGYDSLPPGCQPAFPNCAYDSDADETDTHPYVGVGVRFKEVDRRWAVRVEYEDINGDGQGSTSMLSVGIAWER